jgi:DNA mismatch repair ATPase MutL
LKLNLISILNYPTGFEFELQLHNTLVFNKVPQIHGEALLPSDFLDYLHHHCLLKSPIPKCVHRILASKACRAAVKFGDALELETCSDIIAKLSSCDIPYNCAHGRPSMFPLLNIEHSTKTKQQNISNKKPQYMNLLITK